MKPIKLLIGCGVAVFHLAILISYDPPPFVFPAHTHIVTRTFALQKPPPVKVAKKAVVIKKKPPAKAPKKVAKIKPKVDKNRKNNDIKVPQPIKPEPPDVSETHESATQLIGFLRRSLRLPEEGAVKVKLTILASGKIKDVEIISTESEHNSHYLLEQIKKMTLPFIGRKSQTLVIAFCNES